MISIDDIYRRDGGICWICRKPVPRRTPVAKLRPTRDHVIPRSRGGRDAAHNLRLAHSKCNNERGNQVPPAGPEAADARRVTIPIAPPPRPPPSLPAEWRCGPGWKIHAPPPVPIIDTRPRLPLSTTEFLDWLAAQPEPTRRRERELLETLAREHDAWQPPAPITTLGEIARRTQA